MLNELLQKSDIPISEANLLIVLPKIMVDWAKTTLLYGHSAEIYKSVQCVFIAGSAAFWEMSGTGHVRIF